MRRLLAALEHEAPETAEEGLQLILRELWERQRKKRLALLNTEIAQAERQGDSEKLQQLLRGVVAAVEKDNAELTEPAQTSTPREREALALTIEEKYTELARLLSLGRERGYVLIDEILEVLPEEVAPDPEELDEIYLRFTEIDIEVIDSPEKLLTVEEEATGERAETPEAVGGPTIVDPALLEKTNDPVRMYLREMGTVKLLDRDGEVCIAKRIEAGEAQVFCALASSPRVLELFLRANEMARRDRRLSRDILSGLLASLDERGRARVGEYADAVRPDPRPRRRAPRSSRSGLRRCKSGTRRADELHHPGRRDGRRDLGDGALDRLHHRDPQPPAALPQRGRAPVLDPDPDDPQGRGQAQDRAQRRAPRVLRGSGEAATAPSWRTSRRASACRTTSSSGSSPRCATARSRPTTPSRS